MSTTQLFCKLLYSVGIDRKWGQKMSVKTLMCRKYSACHFPRLLNKSPLQPVLQQLSQVPWIMPNGWNGSLCSCVVVGSARNTDWPPHHWELRAEFEDGSEITFTDTQGGLDASGVLTAPQTVNHCRALVLTHCWTFQLSQNSLTWCRAIVPKWRHYS